MRRHCAIGICFDDEMQFSIVTESRCQRRRNRSVRPIQVHSIHVNAKPDVMTYRDEKVRTGRRGEDEMIHIVRF